ncbi:mevalonate kinase [Patescibacteria group bacterium]
MKFIPYSLRDSGRKETMNNKKVVVSVPGKINLMGEHAIVHGKPAILVAVNMRMKVTVEKAKSINSKVKSEDISEIKTTENTDYVKYIVGIVKRHFKLKKLPPVKIVIESEVPAGYHLGSSACVAVGVSAALSYYLKKIWNPQLFNQLGFEAEKHMHGNPSGGDNTAVTIGGFIWFRKELDFLSSVWQLNIRLSESLNHFYLVDTGKPEETTGDMIKMVGLKVRNQNSKMRILFDENEAQTKRVAMAIKRKDEKVLIDALKIGGKTLEDMGVVSDFVLPFIRKVEKSGGAAKILGGGGKKKGTGYLLVYHNDFQKVRKIAKYYDFSIKKLSLGAEGVRLEKK